MIYIVLAAAGIYCFLCGLLYVFQEKLIFFPPSPVADIYNTVKQNEISLVSQGKKIYGWKIDVKPEASRTMLYFGGNAEDVVDFNIEAEKFNIQQVFAFNYPGYGKSEGKPSQQSLYQYALDVYDFVINKYNLKPGDIIVTGRSLGSSVATYLAANREISGLVLITPFDSIKNIAVQQYKYFPVKFILKHSFYTIKYIQQVKSRILILAAEKDETIARIHLENLSRVLGANSKLVKYQDVGHNTIQTHPEYYNEQNRFISSMRNI